MKHRVLLLLMTLVLLLTMALPAAAEPLRRVYYTQNRIRAAVGETFSIVPQRDPEGSEGEISYTARNKLVQINEDGTATALKPGSEIISAWYYLRNGTRTRVYLYVDVYTPAEDLELYTSARMTGKPLTRVGMLVNTSTTFTVGLVPRNASAKGLTFEVEDDSIAKVIRGTRIRAYKQGTTTLKVTLVTQTWEYPLTVYGSIRRIKLSASARELTAGQTMQLAATNEKDEPVDALYSSTNEKVATVDENGLVTALAPGRIRIYARPASGENRETSMSLTVKETVTGFSLPETLRLGLGESKTLKAAVTPSKLILADPVWHSSNEAVASVNADGVVTAHALGTATITLTSASLPDMQANCLVLVGSPVSAITLNAPTEALWVGDTWSLSPVVAPADAVSSALTWHCEPAGIVDVAEDGTVTALAEGEATVTASAADDSGVTAQVSVLVTTPVQLALPPTIELSVGVTYTPEQFAVPGVAWTLSRVELMEQTPYGFKALLPGTLTLTAQLHDQTAVCFVRITQFVSSISFVSTKDTMTVGETFLPTVSCLPLTAENRRVAWHSSDPQVASVNEIGLITAHTPGETIITATTTDGSKLSAQMPLTVTAQ